MVTQENFKFIQEATGAKISESWTNNHCDTLELQVSGTFTDLSATVEGKVDINAEWTQVGTVNLTKFAKALTLTEKGIYAVDIGGLFGVRVNVTSVSGGNVTIFGRVVTVGG